VDERPGEPADEELALRAKAGCRPSFDLLLARYGRRLTAFLRPRVASGQDVEDIVQETFLRLFRYLDRYDPRWKFSTWVYTIAGRLAIGYYRSQSKTRKAEGAAQSNLEAFETSSPPCAQPNLWEAARRLPPKQYQALWLFYTEDMTVQDVAGVMGKTSLAVRMLLHHGRRNLAGLISRADIPAAAGQRPTASGVRFKENLG
jgi:RNA polymerase sigma-70 factor (ECF subfamily)